MSAIFRMPNDERARVAARSVGRRVRVAHAVQRGPASKDEMREGYLVSLARYAGVWIIVLSKRLTADGIGDVALPLSQVRSIERVS